MVSAVTGERARSQLAGTRFADLRWVAETGSTNDDVLALAQEGGTDGVVLVADAQTRGRGRLGRSWQAPPGSSLLASILLRPPLAPVDAHLASTAVGCAAAQACSEITGVEVSLKWPNDLIVEPDPTIAGGGTKLGGILAESIVDGERLAAVVVGLGLNVNWPDEVPDDLRGLAIALNHLAGAPVDREDLLVALLRHLDGWCDRLASAEGREELLEDYRRRCATVGSRVKVELAHESFEGTAIDITGSGHLLVRRDGSDTVEEVTAGDVVHVRTP